MELVLYGHTVQIQDDALQIDGAEVYRIWYFFWQDKLAAISVSIKGFSNFKALKTVTFDKFGKGIQSDHSKDENYVLNGDVTKVSIYYCNDFYEGGVLMRSTEIQTQRDKFEAEQLKNRSKQPRFFETFSLVECKTTVVGIIYLKPTAIG